VTFAAIYTTSGFFVANLATAQFHAFIGYSLQQPDAKNRLSIVRGEIVTILVEAFRNVAPKKFIAELDDTRPAADRKFRIAWI